MLIYMLSVPSTRDIWYMCRWLPCVRNCPDGTWPVGRGRRLPGETNLHLRFPTSFIQGSSSQYSSKDPDNFHSRFPTSPILALVWGWEYTGAHHCCHNQLTMVISIGNSTTTTKLYNCCNQRETFCEIDARSAKSCFHQWSGLCCGSGFHHPTLLHHVPGFPHF